LPGDRLADSLASPGDQGALAGELQVHERSSSG
jgi:hypothetical protein